jgi:predicted DNA-binding helix-hairpin-helix protein
MRHPHGQIYPKEKARLIDSAGILCHTLMVNIEIAGDGEVEQSWKT